MAKFRGVALAPASFAMTSLLPVLMKDTRSWHMVPKIARKYLGSIEPEQPALQLLRSVG
jgi:hypothetical protein